jgi:hypothetical protein
MIPQPQLRLLGAPLIDRQLLPQSQILGSERCPRTNEPPP